jgi:hypothetical protein
MAEQLVARPMEAGFMDFKRNGILYDTYDSSDARNVVFLAVKGIP